MSKFFPNVVKNINSISYYYLLSDHQDYAVIGLKVRIVENRSTKFAVFSHGSWNIERDFPVFFMIKTKNDTSICSKKFRNHNIPILQIEPSKDICEIIKKNMNNLHATALIRKNCTIEEFQKVLDSFVEFAFGY
jgi:hypothetical protein